MHLLSMFSDFRRPNVRPLRFRRAYHPRNWMNPGSCSGPEGPGGHVYRHCFCRLVRHGDRPAHSRGLPAKNQPSLSLASSSYPISRTWLRRPDYNVGGSDFKIWGIMSNVGSTAILSIHITFMDVSINGGSFLWASS